MPTSLLHRFQLFGPGRTATRRVVGVLLALVCLAALVAAVRQVQRTQRQEGLARAQVYAVSAAAMTELCVEGAVLFNDVRWAVACKALGDEGQGNGIADCDLPDPLAARLYASLQQEERRCEAEAKAFSLR